MEKNLFLKNCLLIDGKSEKPIEKAGILIKGQKIAEVGRTSSIDVTRRDRPTEINLAGKTVIPGMVDAHFHAMYSCFTTMWDMELKDSLELATLKAAQNLQTKLESGFTTVRDVGCRGNMAVALRDAVDSGLVFGPRIVASSQIISSTGGLTDWLPSWTTWKDSREGLGVSVDGVDEITRVVRGQIRDGVDNVKLGASGTGFNPFCPPRRPTLTYNEMVAAIDLAHKSQKTVAVHAEATEAVKNGVKAGANTIEHGMFLDNECIRLLKQSGTVLIPTLANYTLYAEKGAQAGVMPSVIEEHKKNQREHRLSVKLAHEAKVKIALGTDSGGTFFPHEEGAYETELLVHCGFTEMEAIQAGTRVGAEAVGLKETLGTVEKGKMADLVVINGNPLKNIKLLRDQSRIAMVIKGGRIVRSSL